MTIKAFNLDYTLGHVNMYDTNGGQNVSIMANPELVTMLTWFRLNKEDLEVEMAIRKRFPNINEVWEQYQLLVNLVKQEMKEELKNKPTW